jgi:hypothetical protein
MLWGKEVFVRLRVAAYLVDYGRFAVSVRIQDQQRHVALFTLLHHHAILLS